MNKNRKIERKYIYSGFTEEARWIVLMYSYNFLIFNLQTGMVQKEWKKPNSGKIGAKYSGKIWAKYSWQKNKIFQWGWVFVQVNQNRVPGIVLEMYNLAGNAINVTEMTVWVTLTQESIWSHATYMWGRTTCSRWWQWHEVERCMEKARMLKGIHPT